MRVAALLFASSIVACSAPPTNDSGVMPSSDAADVQCSPACGVGEICVAGVCYARQCDPRCAPGDVCIDGSCFAPRTDAGPDSIDVLDAADAIDTPSIDAPDVANGEDTVDSTDAFDTIDDVPDAHDVVGAADAVDAPPCGALGEMCCAGSTCTALGAICASGSCARGPYSGCPDVGSTCATGTSSTGAMVPTTCQRPMISNPGTDGFCSATCTASAEECPTWLSAGRTYTYNCYILQGTTQGQCFIDCPSAESCPVGTVCAMVPNSLGSQVRLCMPMPG